MSKGTSGHFSGTKGSNAAVGSVDYMKTGDSFSSYKKRKDSATPRLITNYLEGK